MTMTSESAHDDANNNPQLLRLGPADKRRCLSSVWFSLVCFTLQTIHYLQATVHQECVERTILLDQLNALRREASLPPLAISDIHAQATSYLRAAEATAAAGAAAGVVSTSVGLPDPSMTAGGGSGDGTAARPPSGGSGIFPPIPRRGSSSGSIRSEGGIPSSSSLSAATPHAAGRIPSARSVGSVVQDHHHDAPLHAGTRDKAIAWTTGSGRGRGGSNRGRGRRARG